MTYLDPDPLYIADDEEPWRTPDTSWMFEAEAEFYRRDRGRPLTVPLVLLCAVLTVLVAVWWVKG